MKNQTFLAQNSTKFWLHKIKALLEIIWGRKRRSVKHAFVLHNFVDITGKPGAPFDCDKIIKGD